MSLLIQQIDPASAPEEILLEMWEYYKAVRAEERPDDPPIPAARQIHNWRASVPDFLTERWIMRDDSGEMVGVGMTWRHLTQNLKNGMAWVHTREDLRRRGLAKTLLEPLLDSLEVDNRNRVETHCLVGSAAEPWLESLGLKMVYVDRSSVLKIDDLDRELMGSWISRAGERASDYELRYYSGDMSDEVVAKYAHLLYQMNTAPLEDYEQEPEVMTPKMWRDLEAMSVAAKYEMHTYIAVHKPTDEFVGSTTIRTDQLWPEHAQQWETLSDPNHRNKGIGRWLKAALIERLLEAGYPIEEVETENADSNQPMLAINVAMGYREVGKHHVYQGDLAKAREILSR